MPISALREFIHTSIRGREIGLDHSRRLVGIPGMRHAPEFSTAGSTLDNVGGMSVLSGSTDAWTLPAPLGVGVEKTIVNASTLSTAAMAIVRSTAQGACGFLGSTSAGGIASTAPGVRFNLIGCGAAVKFISVSSAIWAPVGVVGNLTSSAMTYTVSTSS